MRFYDNGSFYSVTISAREVQDFAQSWPCSGMRGAARGIAAQFKKSNGDLVDIRGERASYDGAAVSALLDDAKEFARPFLECTNCGGPLPETHGVLGCNSGKRRFCDACAGLAAALAIGTRTPAFLYESSGVVTAWTGAVLGHVVRRTDPPKWRRFAPVRYRVRMLDGSQWHGSGPSSNGNYIRLRPLKGA